MYRVDSFRVFSEYFLKIFAYLGQNPANRIRNTLCTALHRGTELLKLQVADFSRIITRLPTFDYMLKKKAQKCRFKDFLLIFFVALNPEGERKRGRGGRRFYNFASLPALLHSHRGKLAQNTNFIKTGLGTFGS
jgi:hypothetical protein